MTGTTRGFALIELLIVIVILGILFTLVLVAVQSQRDRARVASALRFGSQIHHALGAYCAGIWDFEEGTGTVAGDSCTGKTGTISGATHGDGIKNDTALVFDGSNDHVAIPDNPDFEGPTRLTISMWIRPDSVATNQMLIEKGDTQVPFLGGAYHLALCDDGTIGVGVFDNGDMINEFGGNTTLNDGSWHHLALAIDTTAATAADQVRLYVDSREQVRGTSSCAPTNNVNDLDVLRNNDSDIFIGIRDNSGIQSLPFAGAINNVRIYKESLSLSSVGTLFQQGVALHSN